MKAKNASWENTGLAKRLKLLSQSDLEASKAWALLMRFMPEIEKQLGKGGTAPKDFTLHDAEHSFRVAEWIPRLVASAVFRLLNPYELTQLLLSAYLHDIGMTPSQRHVERHYRHLVFPKDAKRPNDWLSAGEERELQIWLDETGDNLTMPLNLGNLTDSTARLAEELITDYCRAKHNDWSQDYIRGLFAGEKPPNYEDLVNDLVKICKSHHEGFSELRSEKFDPRKAGENDRIVHLRFLACLLRMADVLDIDPERTPEVIFRHRDIRQSSILFWRKDHVSWVLLDEEHKQMSLIAYPESAVMEKAIRDTANWIDSELKTCARLAKETPFDHCAFRAKPLKHYKWTLPGWLKIDIQANQDSYVFIDGAFRPDANKILKLFTGTLLYRNHFHAVRELLQNAFDAVREAIAYRRLEREPNSNAYATLLAQEHIVELRFESNSSGCKLICKDSGVGMGRSLIENYFLVSGTAKRRETLELERKCANAGFTLERTGQFGVGVLAYFMIGNQVALETRRDQLAPGDDGSGWRFSTSGLGSFGELKRTSRKSSGTDVTIELRPEIVADQKEWYNSLLNYLLKTLVRIPCRFKVTTNLPNAAVYEISPGWVLPEAMVGRPVHFSPYNVGDSEFLPQSILEGKAHEKKVLGEAFESAKRRLRTSSAAGELPRKAGYYRLILPYFELENGASLGFLDFSSNGFAKHERSQQPLNEVEGVTAGWRGMSIDTTLRHLLIGGEKRGVVNVEIDLINITDAEIDVSRSHLGLAEQLAEELDRFLCQRIGDLLSQFCKEHSCSPYASLNASIARRYHNLNDELKWVKQNKEQNLSWKKISLPAGDINSRDSNWFFADNRDYFWKAGKVQLLLRCPYLSFEGKTESAEWAAASPVADRILVSEPWEQVLPIWETAQQKQSYLCKLCAEILNGDKHAIGGPFPRDWPVICAINETWVNSVVVNTAHQLFEHCDLENFEWCYTHFYSSWNPLTSRNDILSCRKKAASWLISVLCDGRHLRMASNNFWLATIERDPEFFKELWDLVFGPIKNNSTEVVRMRGLQMDVVTPKEWLTLDYPKDSTEMRRRLPAPQKDWRYTFTDRM